MADQGLQSPSSFRSHPLPLKHILVGRFLWEEPLSSVPAASPVVKPLPSVVQAVESEEVLLPCEASGIPQPVVIWQKEGLSIPEGETSQWPARRARGAPFLPRRPPPTSTPGRSPTQPSPRSSPTFCSGDSFLPSFLGVSCLLRHSVTPANQTDHLKSHLVSVGQWFPAFLML